jgi:hypothetical protein
MRKAVSALILVFIVGLPLAVVALPTVTHAVGIPYWGPLVSCVGNKDSLPSSLPACQSICDLLTTGQNILYFILTIALFVLLPIAVAIGGFQMMISGGSAGGESAGKKIITGAFTALLIIMGAYLIVNTIFFFAGKFTDAGKLNTNWATIQCSVPASANDVPSPGAGPAPVAEKIYYACVSYDMAQWINNSQGTPDNAPSSIHDQAIGKCYPAGPGSNKSEFNCASDYAGCPSSLKGCAPVVASKCLGGSPP